MSRKSSTIAGIRVAHLRLRARLRVAFALTADGGRTRHRRNAGAVRVAEHDLGAGLPHPRERRLRIARSPGGDEPAATAVALRVTPSAQQTSTRPSLRSRSIASTAAPSVARSGNVRSSTGRLT